eukprot:6377409-Ditylum_brightwellii.AAC.1
MGIIPSSVASMGAPVAHDTLMGLGSYYLAYLSPCSVPDVPPLTVIPNQWSFLPFCSMPWHSLYAQLDALVGLVLVPVVLIPVVWVAADVGIPEQSQIFGYVYFESFHLLLLFVVVLIERLDL